KIAPPQRDVLVAGAHQDSAGGVGVGHRERAGPARRLVVLLRLLHEALGDPLWAVEPLVLLLRAPHDHDQLSARDQGLPNVAASGWVASPNPQPMSSTCPTSGGG